MKDLEKRLDDWATKCFGCNTDSYNHKERVYRILEEALEANQCSGISKEEAIALVDQVYSKEPGNIIKELGDIGVTLILCCIRLNLPVRNVIENRIKYCEENVEKIRDKNKLKVKPIK
jgi:hypothetical protein